MINEVDPRRELASLTTAEDQNPEALKMWSATTATRRVLLSKVQSRSKGRKEAENSSTAEVAMENKAELFSISSGKPISDSWILDSGCTFHVCKHGLV